MGFRVVRVFGLGLLGLLGFRVVRVVRVLGFRVVRVVSFVRVDRDPLPSAIYRV